MAISFRLCALHKSLFFYCTASFLFLQDKPTKIILQNRKGAYTINEEQREHFKELCAVWIDHLNQIISFHPADGFEQLPFATHEAQMHFALEKCKDGYKIQ